MTTPTAYADACERAAETLNAQSCFAESLERGEALREDEATLRALATALREGRVTINEEGTMDAKLTALAATCVAAAELMEPLCSNCARHEQSGDASFGLCDVCKLNVSDSERLRAHARAIREGRVTIREETR